MPKWETNGSRIDKNINNLLYTNKAIERFLSEDNANFIVAGKGLGKTLILKKKRINIYHKYKNNVTYIPSDSPFLDTISEFNVDTISNSLKEKLAEIHESKSLWTLALKISIISFHIEQNSDFIKKNILKTDIKLYKITPSNVMSILLSKSISEIKRIQKDIHSYVNNYFTIVHSKTFVFIDRIDQSLYEFFEDADIVLAKQIWVSMQAGLMLAAWEVMENNNHVKIYLSIRQEAFANIKNYKQDFISMDASIIHVSYKSNELKKIIDKLSIVYEKQDLYKFIGFEKINNTFFNTEEDVFCYMRRHTLNRPRDLVAICSKISNLEEINQNSLREIVNKKASYITNNYFEEQKPFLNTFINKIEREKLFKLLNSNILIKEDTKDICSKFNDKNCNGIDCHLCDKEHPFCELYNIGLLGVLEKDNVNNKLFQKFLKPSEVNLSNTHSLPNSELYLLHPSLENLINDTKRKYNMQLDYEIIPKMIIGDGRSWDKEYVNKIISYRLLSKANNDSKNKEILKNELLINNDVMLSPAKIKEIVAKLPNKVTNVAIDLALEKIINLLM